MINLIKKWLNRKSHNEELIYTESIESTPSIDPIEIEDELPVVIEDEIEVEEVSESEEKFLSLSKEMTMNRNSIYSEIIEFIPTGIRTSVMNLNIIQRNQMFLRYLGCSNRTLHENDKIWSSLKNIDILKMTLPEIEKSIKSLWDYLNPSENDKKKYGEVFTPFDLVNEMLDKLPTYVWSKPNLKWLEPANGVGNFAIVIIKRLMIGLEGWEPDEEKRYKHIIENMIYVCELQAKNMFIWLFTIDRENKYDVKFYRESFLGDGFSDKMKEWGVEKFDVVVGNPPYQEISTQGRSKGGGTGGDNNLWSKFSSKSMDVTDYLLFIHPPSFLSPSHNLLEKFKLMGGFMYFKIYNESPFENVSTNACFYLFKKSYKGDTLIGDSYIKFDMEFFPNSTKIIDFIIFNKFFKSHKIMEFKRTCSLHTVNKKRFINKERNNDFIYPLFYGSKILYSSIKSEFHDLKKVVVSRSGYLNPTYDDGISSLSETNYFVEVKSENHGKNLINILNSKLYDYVLKKSKFSGFFHGEVLKNIPMIPTDKEWTDDEIFEYFGISAEEKIIVLNKK